MTIWMPRKKPLYAPMLATFGGGSANGFRGSSGGGGLTLAEHYADGTSAGLQDVNFNGTIYTLNYVVMATKVGLKYYFMGM